MADAPGGPGVAPRWTTGDKAGVGTALSAASRVWFTLARGILAEAYYPQAGQTCLRDFGFLVTDGEGFFAEERRDCDSTVQPVAEGVPAFVLVNTHRAARPRFRIHKRVLTDPARDVLLQEVRLEVLDGGSLRLFALVAPQLTRGEDTGWVGDYKGVPMLFAEGGGSSLALAADVGWGARSAGFAGISDGWQDLSRHFRMTWEHDRAPEGNVALCGELPLGGDGRCVVALGCGRAAGEAAFRARASLGEPFGAVLEGYRARWAEWQGGLRPLDRAGRRAGRNTYRVSTATLRTHETSGFAGGAVASLSVPWGGARGDEEGGGYHLVWPRDMVEVGGALLAAGAHAEVRRALSFLWAIQEPDGSWPRNCWLDGTPYWDGAQMDECAFPVLLLALALREGAVEEGELGRFWPGVRAAAAFLVRRGPATGQDRWEENGGYSPFTLAVEVAALLEAAAMAERCGPGSGRGSGPGGEGCAAFLRETADGWNARIEEWTFVTGTALCAEAGVRGHYLRLAPGQTPGAGADKEGAVQIRNRPEGEGLVRADSVVSPDALALVRFGLRAADDPRVRDTLRVIDRRLRVELPGGEGWHRYNGDGYGERADGEAFDGAGVGRVWPLLTGERAHYALMAGDEAGAERLLDALESAAGEGALLPEQVWDEADLPERGLWRGRPTGSANPLAWAHAEHVKLLRSLADRRAGVRPGRVFDTPEAAWRRYAGAQAAPAPRVQSWRPDWQAERLPAGRGLRVELARASTVHWSGDGWASAGEVPTTDTGLGLHVADLPCESLPPGAAVVFTWRDGATGEWAGADHRVAVESEGVP